jgi:PhnB protein
MINLSPYLNFNGTCEEAMNFYQKVLGGTVEITRFKEMPMPGHESDGEKIMHSTLKTEDITFMASDGGMGEIVMGDSVNLSVSGSASDEEKLRGFFNGLSEGGKIVMPLDKVPWGAYFGMFVDKFGINWMFNIETELPAVA